MPSLRLSSLHIPAIASLQLEQLVGDCAMIVQQTHVKSYLPILCTD